VPEEGKSKKAKGRGSQLFIKSGRRSPFTFLLLPCAFFPLPSTCIRLGVIASSPRLIG
jgi:hypothetical protein